MGHGWCVDNLNLIRPRRPKNRRCDDVCAAGCFDGIRTCEGRRREQAGGRALLGLGGEYDPDTTTISVNTCINTCVQALSEYIVNTGVNTRVDARGVQSNGRPRSSARSCPTDCPSAVFGSVGCHEFTMQDKLHGHHRTASLLVVLGSVMIGKEVSNKLESVCRRTMLACFQDSSQLLLRDHLPREPSQ